MSGWFWVLEKSSFWSFLPAQLPYLGTYRATLRDSSHKAKNTKNCRKKKEKNIKDNICRLSDLNSNFDKIKKSAQKAGLNVSKGDKILKDKVNS